MSIRKEQHTLDGLVFPNLDHFLGHSPSVGRAHQVLYHWSFLWGTCALDTNASCRGPFIIPGIWFSAFQYIVCWFCYIFLQGRCPGLTHGQKYGISYAADPESFMDGNSEDESANEPEVDVSRQHSIVLISNSDANTWYPSMVRTKATFKCWVRNVA